MPKRLAKIAKIIAILVITCWLFLFVGSFRTSHVVAHAAACKNNLQSIATAKARWAEDEHETTNDAPTWSDLVGTNRYLHFHPVCPDGGVYVVGRVGVPPKCTVTGHSL